MDPLSKSQEGELSVSVLKLKTDHDIIEKDSFNKRATKFLALIEAAMRKGAEAEATIKFEDFVIQMLDLSVDRKLGTQNDITRKMNEVGWNTSQVTKEWQVSTGPEINSTWSLETLLQLARRRIQTDV